ncbi:MAG: hypothetical protein DRJ09_10435 [Bacteroidetes bacterium]|nr:MAG: hypothetical protein DRJ09_10435 [Bacteroidota bacterium]
MKNLKIYMVAILLVISWQGYSQETKAWAKPDTTAITIGDQIGVELGVRLNKEALLQWPQITDTLTGNIEVVKQSGIDTTFDADNIILKQRLTITSFDSGYFKVPSVNFLYRLKGDSAVFTVGTNSFFLQVNTPEVDTAQPFKTIVGPIEEPYTFGEIAPWVLLGLMALAAIAFLIFYLKKRKNNQPLFKAKPKPLPPPDVEAINKLEELKLARVWQSGKVKLYHSSLTDIMKNYLKRRFGFNAPEMTTDEIVSALADKLANDEALNKLRGTMQLADLVKFAKAQPTPLENDLSLEHCLDFVNETKSVVVVPDVVEKEKTDLLDNKEEK